MSSSNITLRLRPSSSRGHANHDWLNTYHTFSFADYSDPKFSSWGALRVINEDRVKGGHGFGEHPHQNFEIFSYIVSGRIRHDDSLGHTETLQRGDVQFTSAGSGLEHSEFNASKTDLLHFLQVWVKPNADGLKPAYQTKRFTDQEKTGKLRLVVSSDGRENSVQINNEVDMYATLLRNEDNELHFTFPPGHIGYLHVVQDVLGYDEEANEVELIVNGEQKLNSGDGAFISLNDKTKPGEIIIRGNHKHGKPTEFVLFDIAK